MKVKLTRDQAELLEAMKSRFKKKKGYLKIRIIDPNTVEVIGSVEDIKQLLEKSGDGVSKEKEA